MLRHLRIREYDQWSSRPPNVRILLSDLPVLPEDTNIFSQLPHLTVHGIFLVTQQPFKNIIIWSMTYLTSENMWICSVTYQTSMSMCFFSKCPTRPPRLYEHAFKSALVDKQKYVNILGYLRDVNEYVPLLRYMFRKYAQWSTRPPGLFESEQKICWVVYQTLNLEY